MMTKRFKRTNILFSLALLTVLVSAGTLMAAGDVSLVVDGTTLEVRGDHKNNLMLVTDNGTYFVFTLLFTEDNTTFNGQPSASIPKAGIDQLMADLGQGGNYFLAIFFDVEMDIHIDTGSGWGADANGPKRFVTVAFGLGSIVGDVEIVGHAGYDSLFFSDMTIDGNLNVDLGANNDTVSLHEVSVTGGVFVDTGSGPDFVRFIDVGVGGNLAVLAGQGNDVVELENEITVAGALTVDGGQGKQDAFFTCFLTLLNVSGGIDIDGFEIFSR